MKAIVPVLATTLVLSACGKPSDPASEGPAPLVIRGELVHPERIALPAETLAVIELRSGEVERGPLVAEQVLPLEGRQVPLAFEFAVPRGRIDAAQSHHVRGAVLAHPAIVRITEPVAIDAGADVVEVAPMRLRPVEQIAFGVPYRCGERSVIFGTLGAHERMIVDGEIFDLKPAVAASGARYETLHDPSTGFWSKGDRATAMVRGETLPECERITGLELPFTARGQEPGWMVRITEEKIELLANLGATRITLPAPEPLVGLDSVRYQVSTPEHRLTVSVQRTICADIMTGMPHPYRVRYELDGEAHTGCGGEPKTLLLGGEWQVQSLAGQPTLEGTEVTIAFLEEDRVAGDASCNRFVGGFVLTGEGLNFIQLGSTMMACAEPISEQERRFHALLGAVYRFSMPEIDQLVLHTPQGETVQARRHPD